VHYNESKNRWIAQPTIKNKRFYKSFKTEEEALNYIKASDELIVNEKLN
jgi:hypothetical protein